MTNTLITTDYTDSSGRKILFDNNVNNIYSYVAEDESWDKTGAGNASWYIENTLPSDTFYGSSLDTSKWAYFNYRGTISGSVSDKLSLDIEKQEARGGISSEDIWSLSGDFDVKLYVDESSYYNEYRSETATGLTVSLGDSYKYRISKYFDGSNVGYKAHNLNGTEEKYLGWFNNGTINTTAGGEETTCLRIKREGDSITSYVSTTNGFVAVGSGVSGYIWSGDADIEIEAQTDQYNTYRMDVVGVSVSGSLSQSKTFSSPLRGSTAKFPDYSLLLVDDDGMSIVDEETMSLWMRFLNSEEYMFKASETNISASSGRVYYTTSSGLVCLDFVGDKAVWYVGNEKRETDVGISGRNFSAPVYVVGSDTFVADKEVLSVDTKKVNGNDFVAVGTISGTGMLINNTQELSGPAGNIQAVYISNYGTLYWNDYSTSTGSGKLYYRNNITNLIGSESSFTSTGYYSTTSTPVSISSENINSVSTKEVGTSKFIATGHSFGIDFVTDNDRVTYGPVNIINPFSDYNFSDYLGVYWTKYTSGLFSAFDITTYSGWYTSGSSSLKLSLKSGSLVAAGGGIVTSGEFGGVYQQINVSQVDMIYFDYKLEASSTTNLVDLEIVVDGAVEATISDTLGSHIKYNNVVNVSDYSGTVVFELRIKSKYSGSCDNSNVFLIDNLRSVQIVPDYSIIPSSSHSVLEVLLLYETDEKKIFFATADGYGAIDVSTHSLDFFNEIDTYVSLSTVLSADYVEYIDEV